MQNTSYDNVKINIIDDIYQHLDLNAIFVEESDAYLKTYKIYRGDIKTTYDSNDIFKEMRKFVSSECYFSRHNQDFSDNDMSLIKYIQNIISGPHLNEKHNFYVKHDFYAKLYRKLLSTYLTFTDFKSINTISVDSSFIRNILGVNADRNPFYNNKPGFKIHCLVDSHGTMISFYMSSCNDGDSNHINSLFDNMFIPIDIFNKNSNTLMADSSYSGIHSLINYSSKNLNILMGRNSQAVKKIKYIHKALKNTTIKYKQRDVAENIFAHIQRYPCLLNNYEKSEKSYRGLFLFISCIMLTKKINIMFDEINNKNLKVQREANTLKSKEFAIKRRKEKYEKKKFQKAKREKENIERNIEIQEKLKVLQYQICKNMKESQFKRTHTKLLKDRKEKLMTIKQGHLSKQVCYNNFKDDVKKGIMAYIINTKLTKTVKYKFNKKELYMIEQQKDAYENENIEKVMNNINKKQLINKYGDIFFRQIENKINKPKKRITYKLKQQITNNNEKSQM